MPNKFQEAEENYARYPNLRSTLPFHVQCAKQENMNNAEQAFKRYCPRELKIVKVNWVRSRDRPYCVWRVYYNSQGCALLPQEGDDLKKIFSLLEEYHPINTAIVKIQRSTDAIVDYGVFCDCDLPNFEIDAVQSLGQQIILGTLYDMLSMKIAIEEKPCTLD